MKNNKIFSSPKAATLAASFVMLVFSIAYYTIAARLEEPEVLSPIAPDSLKIFPIQIADWTGQDIPIEENIVSNLGTDAYINRLFTRHGGKDSINLFISCSFSAYEKSNHRPEVCYPSAGWKLLDKQSMQLLDTERKKLPFTIFKFTKGDFENQQTSVLHYYIVDGMPFNNLSFAQPRLWRVFEKVTYIARVMIVASDYTLLENVREQIVKDFAVESAPFIARMFNDIEKKRKSEDSPKALAGN